MGCSRSTLGSGSIWTVLLLAICVAGSAGAGVRQWTTGGPTGAGVRQLAIDPVTPSTVYMAGYGMWKSTDAGATWSRLPGLGPTNIQDVVINPDDSSVLLSGSFDAGVFRSTDGGASWATSNQGLPGVIVLSLAMDPSTPSTVYAGLRYQGAHKSTDGGLTWSAINDGIGDNRTITVLAVDPVTPQTVFAGTYDGTFMSVDGGASWSAVSGGLPASSVASIAIDPTDSSVIYVGMDGQGVSKSTDGGATWNAVNTGLDHQNIEDVAVDPDEPTTVHLATDGGGLYKSADAGATWVRSENGPRTVTVKAVSLVSSSPNIVYAGTYAAGVYKSTDGGETWRSTNDGLKAAYAKALAVDPVIEGKLWTATIGGVWRSDDSGATWVSRDGDLALLNAASIAQDPENGDTLYVATWRGLFKTENGGTNWALTDSDPTPSYHEAVATHPVISDLVYAGNWHGLVMSGDGGETWVQPDTGPKDQRVLSFAFEPGNPATMYAGAWDGIFRSDDHGETWTSSLVDETIWSIAVDPVSTDTLYVCTYNGVFKSTDGGLTWTPASNGLTAQYCWALAIDADSPSTIYQGSHEGVFRSMNGGADWSPFSGLEAYNIHDLQFSPDGGTLFAATNGGGVGAYSFAGSGCEIECSAIVPETAFAGSDVYFQAAATAVGCSSSPSYEWDFGDGAAPVNGKNISHTYDAAGSFDWSMTARADGVSCTSAGSIEVWAKTTTWYVPGAAHAPGAGGTSWRTDLAAVNPGPTSITFDLSFFPYDGGPRVERSHTLAAGHATEWSDVLVALFGIAAGDSTKGTVGISSISPLYVTSRTYNQTTAGTFGQYLPALPAASVVGKSQSRRVNVARPGDVGVIPHLKKSSEFRSNLGVQNLGVAPVTVEIKLYGKGGDQLGNTNTRTVDVGRYWQLNDVFATLGAGSPAIAFATVEVVSSDGLAWFYGSVVDNDTGDPTTVPVLLPRVGDNGIAGVAHAPGAGGTTWRTDIAAVYLGGDNVQFEPEFTAYNGGTTTVAEATIVGPGTVGWTDVLVSLFGQNPAASVKGTLTFASMPDLYVTARTYNQTAGGTFGQYLPAVTAAEGFGVGAVGVIPQLKKNTGFRSNLGVLNLSPFDVVAEIRLYNSSGAQAGDVATRTVRANEYFQIDDVFSKLSAGELNTAYGTIQVKTSGGRVWAYGSVVDNSTGDPTTIPALVE